MQDRQHHRREVDDQEEGYVFEFDPETQLIETPSI
jgi:hypothetical protein